MLSMCMSFVSLSTRGWYAPIKVMKVFGACSMCDWYAVRG